MPLRERLGIEVHTMGDGFTWDTKDPEQDRRTARATWELCVGKLRSGDYDLLVFDDVSSALDARTEAELWDGLFRETDATCLVVSHRRAALTRADRILLLEGGRLTHEGTLDDLLSRSPEMRALWAEEGDVTAR